MTSFGGYTALVSVLSEELVEKKKVISEETILDGLSVASLLPGPLAVNVVTLIGYKLRGWVGAIVSLLSVLLPPFILMIVVAELYGRYANLDIVNKFLEGAIAVIIALILSMCYKMIRKNVSKVWQAVLLVLILVMAFFFNSYLWIVGFILLGGLVGYIFKENAENEDSTLSGEKDTKPLGHLLLGVGLIVATFAILLVLLNGIYFQLLLEFAKVSLTLFGGGYVMIPLLHEIVVENFNWISSDEFASAIAFGQVTPGPILVSATYIGYKLGGLFGAFLATIGIFIPSAVVMVVVGSAFDSVKNNLVIGGIMKGVRPVIIALIGYSGWILFQSLEHGLYAGAIIAISFIVITYTKFSYFLVILIAGVLGILIS